MLQGGCNLILVSLLYCLAQLLQILVVFQSVAQLLSADLLIHAFLQSIYSRIQSLIHVLLILAFLQFFFQILKDLLQLCPEFIRQIGVLHHLMQLVDEGRATEGADIGDKQKYRRADEQSATQH